MLGSRPVGRRRFSTKGGTVTNVNKSTKLKMPFGKGGEKVCDDTLLFPDPPTIFGSAQESVRRPERWGFW
jgi:hypothetical protein